MRTDRFALVMLAACAVALCAPARQVKAENSLTIGDQWWLQTRPEAKFREFRDIPQGPFLESLVLEKWNEKTTYALWGKNAMQDDQAWRGLWASGTRLNVKVGWIETPHIFSFTTRSPYTEVRPGVFVLPDSLQALNRRVSNNTNVANALRDALEASRQFPLQFSTNVGTARVRMRPARGWSVELNGRQTKRDGGKAYAAFIGTSPGNPTVELWEPIHQTLIDGDVRANYDNERVTVQVVGGTSTFDNALDRMTWDNARSLYDIPPVRGFTPPRDSIASVPGRGQLALPPDNREMRGSVAIGVHLPRRSLLSGTVSYAQVRQDQDWLPVTINSALRPDTMPMPGTNTDGQANILNLDARVTTMALDRVRGTLRFHSDKYDNKTPEFHFLQTVNGDIAKVGPFETKPFANNNWVAGLDVDAEPMERVSVGATAELRTRERDHREVTKDTENVFGVRAKVRPMNGLTLDARARFGNRELDEFHIEDYQTDAGAFFEQPTLRRPDVANRKQTQVSAGAWWMPIERVDVSLSYSHLKNDYEDLEYGLTKDQSDVLATQGVLHVHSRLDLRGGYGFGVTKTAQRSIQGNTGTIVTGPGRDTLAWTADVDDKSYYVNTGFDLWIKPEKFSIVGDYEFSRDKTVFDLEAGSAFTSPFVSASNRFTGDVPTTFYRRHELMTEARYQLLPSTQIALRYAWEEFDIIDFAAKDVPQVASGAAALYLGDFFQDYRAHRVALVAKHTF